MIFDFFGSHRDDQHFFAPEVVQTSAMDCGPAALKCLLEGFGISASYGRLREACQTDVDGTSINMIEDVAVQLGLEAVQTILPPDNFILPESQNLPALVVIRLPNGLTHFVVAWRRHGSFIQIMDPATGRRLVSEKQFLRQLYIHEYSLPADAWRTWAGTDGFCAPLRQRMLNLSLDKAVVERLIETALLDVGWRSLAALDAATRFVSAIKRAKALLPSEIGSVLEHFFQQASAIQTSDTPPIIPSSYFSVQTPPDNPAAPYLLLRGAVLIRVFGRRETSSDANEEAEAEPQARLSPELVAALEEVPMQPLRRLLTLLQEDGPLIPALLGLALFVASLDLMIETALFRSLLDIGVTLRIEERINAVLLLFIFLIGLLFIESPLATIVLRLGRGLESRLRIEFLSKIPRLGDRYFHSRLISDMAQRAYELRQIRTLPTLSVQWVRLIFEILLTSGAVIWINPTSAKVALFATIFTIAFSLITQPFLVEQDLAMRTHVGALSRFYLDALLGLLPIRTHGAERAVRRQQESLLVTWAEASKRFHRINIIINTITALISTAFTIWIVKDYMNNADNLNGIILLFYWTLRLPVLGRALAQSAQQLPMLRNRVLRLLEPLGAPEEAQERIGTGSLGKVMNVASPKQAIAIEMKDLTVQAGGHKILENITLSIKAGTHVAIVGSSGAGKSSLVGLLLGWYRPAIGQILINGQPLTGKRLLTLRNQTAWVDPAVQLWNRSMLANLEYGATEDKPELLNTIIRQADLINVLEKMPNGLQTQLGESGGLLSGGEGQRVRLGRAMYRKNVGLVILDEAFRGLDRDKRRQLLAQAREFWCDATLLFISHDVEQTQDFERVLVIEKGQIVEDDVPSSLISQPNSRYRTLLLAEEAVRRGLWESTEWTHLWLSDGRLSGKRDEVI